MKHFLKLTLAALASISTSALVLAQPVPEMPNAQGWAKAFDGTTLSGWEMVDPGGWEMKDGVLLGKGPRSHLFSPRTYTNVEFKAEIRLNNKGNSGMYFRAQKGPGWPKGYEAQVENTSSDPQRTGSLYNLSKVTEQLIQDDTWWTQHVIAIGKRTLIKVNGKVVTDFVDEKATHTAGYLALQQHDPGSKVEYKNVMIRRLPSDEQAALAIAEKETPELAK